MTASDQDRQDSIENCPLFHNMMTAGVHEILGLMETRTYKPGDLILQEGQSLQYLGVVLSGKCQVARKSTAGNELILAVLEKNAVFGEMSFFSPAPHSANVRAMTDVEVKLLARDKYDMLLRVGSVAAYKLGFNVVQVLASRLRRMDQWICELLEKTPAQGHHEEWHDFQSKLYSGWQF